MQRAELNALTEVIKNEGSFTDQLITEISKVIVGQKYMIERLVIGLLCNGHILLKASQDWQKLPQFNRWQRPFLTFNRIQFTQIYYRLT